MCEDDIIKTSIFRSDASFLRRREQRINEALAFAGGTIKRPKKHVVAVLPGGPKAYFLKPGKETQRQTPNIHDMTPRVGDKFAGYTFEDIWEYLVKISIINQILFKKVLVLLYRLCFFIDHRADKAQYQIFAIAANCGACRQN